VLKKLIYYKPHKKYTIYKITIKNKKVKPKCKSSTGWQASATMQKSRCGGSIGHCHHLSFSQVLLRSKSTENLPSHIRPPASCARGEMHPAFLGIVAGRIFLWVQAQDIRRKDDDNDRKA